MNRDFTSLTHFLVGAISRWPRKQKVTEIVVVPDEPAEVMYPGCMAVSAISQAVCQAAAVIDDIPLYQHIARCMSACEVTQTHPYVNELVHRLYL